MEKFEIELDDDYLILIGRITVNFAILEQLISFFIWNLIEYDEVCKSILTETRNTHTELVRSWIEYFISTLSGLEKGYGTKLGQIITAELSFRQKTNLLSSICRDKLNNPTDLAELDQILTRVVQAEQKRNTVIHSFWTGHTGHPGVARVKATAKRRSKGLKLEVEHISVKDLEDVATFIVDVAYEVQTLIIRFYIPDFND